jgi:hypothetical protein
MKSNLQFVLISLVLFCGAEMHAKTDAKQKQNLESKPPVAVAPSNRPSILSTPIRKPASLDPNSAVEVRGQARTLSMMLVLKNGKDAINFIKPRKDYRPEIAKTEF